MFFIFFFTTSIYAHAYKWAYTGKIFLDADYSCVIIYPLTVVELGIVVTVVVPEFGTAGSFIFPYDFSRVSPCFATICVRSLRKGRFFLRSFGVYISSRKMKSGTTALGRIGDPAGVIITPPLRPDFSSHSQVSFVTDRSLCCLLALDIVMQSILAQGCPPTSTLSMLSKLQKRTIVGHSI